MVFPPDTGWLVQTQHVRVVRHNGRALSVIIQASGPKKYLAIAVEAADGPPSLERVFADHAHAIITPDPIPYRAATCAANAYIKAWKAAAGVEAPPERCDCGVIVSPMPEIDSEFGDA